MPCSRSNHNHMTPQDLIAKWGPGGPASGLNEEQGAQSHFLGLCDVLSVAKPGSEPGYLFEQGSRLAGQASGYADVYKRGAFTWENKAPGKNLDAALRQLQAHTELDAAVAAACGWADYRPQMCNDELLARLLALNLARAAQQSA